jgi:predicted  nucleic acid-binding Zn-ribbon protein
MDHNTTPSTELQQNDIHPVELIAHSLLSGSLENLTENFDQLHQSQIILLTRLNLIEQKLAQFTNKGSEITHTDTIAKYLAAIKTLRKRLGVVIKTLDKVDKRVAKIDAKLAEET